MAPIIQITNLYKQYESESGVVTPVLKDVNFAIEAGEFVAVMGPSGSGKSTLMNIIGCLDVPTSGEYLLGGRSVGKLGADQLSEVRNKMLGFVFQGFNLLPRRDAENNVAIPLLYAGLSRQESLSRARELLTKVGIGQLAKSLPNQMSGGQQQRVAIARAIAANPKVILADEPTGNLDTKTSFEIIKIFQELNQKNKITVILVTHEADIAHAAERLIRLKDGVKVYDGKVKDYEGEAL